MAHLDSSVRRLPRQYAPVLAFVVSLLPLGTAFAQTLPHVRVTDEIAIQTFRHFDDQDFEITVAPAGTMLEVIFTEGDAFRHLQSNWYWVLLPRDQWGTKRAGWVSGRHVQPAPAPQREAIPSSTPAPAPAREEPSPVPPQPVADPDPAAEEAPAFADVVVHFAFDKSDLSEEARTRLNEAVALLETQAFTVAFALEGHADATGREAYNEKLGLARAERVKQYLAEQHEIAVEKISVVSYGETKPASSNATREGRAENRRVVLKIER